MYQTLTKYWGYTHFLPMQEEIIYSVLAKRDSLALLPTGGGKSMCFQVPAMMQEGICIVISPLIALMNDQVENLKKRGIKAISINSGMTRREIDIALDNCIYGKVKFLYLSPERLPTELFQKRLVQMNVNLLVVDEAHCISQWGYNFRPHYLNIALIRDLLPNVPVLALTATATPDVVKDIQEKLKFKKENVFKTTFERENLTYAVVYDEDKHGRLVKLLAKLVGSGIIYVRNRKRAQEIANFLINKDISAFYYHAGMEHTERAKTQQNWMTDKTRIIVATNAFGMGIDKSNVRFVIHYDVPDCIEAYFQEAGRAGRDWKKAYAILISSPADREELDRQFEESYPTIEDIKRTYQSLANYFQLPVGSGLYQTFNLNMQEFCGNFELPMIQTFNSLKILEREGYFSITDSVYVPSRLHFLVHKDVLYDFQVRNRYLEQFIKLLLRSYGGLFDEFVIINEHYLAKELNVTEKIVKEALTKLDAWKILNYSPSNSAPRLTFTQERKDVNKLSIYKETLFNQKKAQKERLNGILTYVENDHKCRSLQLLRYFGDTGMERCGQCDVCLERNKLEISKLKFDSILSQIKEHINHSPLLLKDLITKIHDADEDEIVKVIEWLLDNDKIYYNEENELKWWDKLF